MSVFDDIFEATMGIEGKKYSLVDKHPTLWGIDRKYWPSWEGWLIVDDWRAGRITNEAFSVVIMPLIKKFYKVQFWDRFRGNEVAELSAAVACEIFESGVNCGLSNGVRFFQEALNMQNNGGAVYPDVEVDGLLGNLSLSTLKRYLSYTPGSSSDNERILLNCMNGEQYIYYKQNPKHEKFRGWFRRV